MITLKTNKLYLLFLVFILTSIDVEAQCPTVNVYGDDGDGNTVTCLSPIDTMSILDVYFFNMTTDAVSYEWDFDDGSPVYITTSDSLFTHTFTYGTYNVEVTAISASGCQVSQNILVIFEKNVVAGIDFILAETGGCVPHTINPINNSENAIVYVWDFGDPASPNNIIITNSSNPPSHTYNQNGCYTVTLTASNTCNSTTSTFGPIEVTRIDTASFEFASDTGCAGQLIPITNSTNPFTCSSSPNMSYYWELGNGVTWNLQNPPPQFYEVGQHTAKLLACNFCGCDSTERTIVIDTLPTVNINVTSTTSGCSPLTFSVLNNSSNNVTSHEWYIDGALTYVSENMPNHIFVNNSSSLQTHIVTYQATSYCGSASKTFLVDVYPGVRADFDPKNPEICSGEFIEFTDQSSGDSISYFWDFGNGITETTQGPHNILYGTAGLYTVTLIVSGSCGADTATTIVNVSDRPIADFSVIDTVCRGESVVFTNLSTVALYYLWDFGDLQSSSQVNPTHQFNTPGNYTVTLFAFSNVNCVDTFSLPIVVNPFPFVSFAYDIVCEGDSTHFTNNSTLGTSWFWDFDDGSTDTAVSPNHLFSNAGSYNVTLTGTNQYGCNASRTHTVDVNAVPSVSIAAPQVCLGETTQFTDLTAGNIVSWNWDFGDGNTSTFPNPQHTYAIFDTFTVTLTVTSASGCTGSGTFDAIVRPGVTASFTTTANACQGDSIFVTSTSSGNIQNYSWYFNEGGIISGNLPVYNHVYSATGSYNIFLAIVDDIGCTDTAIQSITVNPGISAAFTHNNVCLGSPMQFIDQTTGGAISWAWDFGDSSGTSSQNPTHVYTTSGNYNVQLTVMNADGCIDSITSLISITSGTLADFSADTVCLGLPTSFTNLSSNASSWIWSFGNSYNSVTENPSHTFSTSGVHQVTLVATNISGCSDTIIKSILVSDAPEVNFGATQVCYPDVTMFTDSSPAAVSWSWTFGDGEVDSIQNPNHLYSSPGSYIVGLTVTNAFGCTAVASDVAIVNALPLADFNFNPVCLSNAVQFTDISVGFPVSWFWDFGDGTTDSVPNPSHVYAATDTYLVTLIIQPGDACYDTISKEVIIYDSPTAGFTHTTSCYGDSIRFTDQSSSDVINRTWSFGDGSTSTLPNPSHLYNSAGTFMVVLTTANAAGCIDRDTSFVIINPAFTVDFTDNASCFGDSVQFNDLSAPNAVSWAWDFGDGTFASNQNPVHLFSGPGNYPVQLISISDSGCVDTFVRNVFIAPLPEVDFQFDTTCVGNPVTFLNLTSGNGPISYQWDFTTAQSNNSNPSFTFPGAGNFPVQLTATSADGCSADTTQDVYVIGGFLVSYTVDTACLGQPTTFTNITPLGGNINVWDFGDGNSISGPSTVSYTYQYPGIYLSSLTASWNNGCSDQKFLLVHVKDSVKAEFSLTTTNFCEQEFVQFNNLSTGNPTYYKWFFGDGDSSSSYAPAHLYSSQGTYTITFVAGNDLGCADTVQQTITVAPVVTAGFINTVSCPGELIQFTDTSSANVVSWFWDFGDNNFSIDQNPSYTYALSGNYSVTLVATSAAGCTDTSVKVITVLPEVLADFSPVAVCGLDPIQFSDLSTGNPVQWAWRFGDGTFNYTSNPQHTYSSTGSYDVELVVMNASGCSDTIRQTVNVYSLPDASFTLDTVCLGTPTSFNNQSTDNNPMIFNWSLGDYTTSSLLNPVHTYGASGNYNVSLVTINLFGCSDTAFQVAQVVDNIVASFSADTVCHGSATQFSNMSSNSGGNIFWDFGDGKFSYLPQPAHEYDLPGTYLVTLSIDNASGCSDTYSEFVIVKANPNADFTFVTACAGESVQFTDTILGGTFTSQIWDFGDNSPLQSGSNVAHVYAQPGTYTVQLTVGNSTGCIDIVQKQVQVSSIPSVDFITNDVCIGQVSSFINLSSDNYPMTFEWQFGDSSISSSNNPNYFYSMPGVYNVHLIATNINGCTNSISQPVEVLDIPVANFIADTVCLGVPTTFTSISTGAIATQTWDFGDGSVNATGSQVTHTYGYPGIYYVLLVVENSIQCTDVISRPIVVMNSVQPAFELSDQTVCIGSSIDAINLSHFGNVTSWTWDMGDGNTVVAPNVLDYTYDEVGTYTVQLVATGMLCSSPAVETITVIESTQTRFEGEDVCHGETVQFQNYSSSSSDYLWEFGDGSTSTDEAPEHQYLNPGFYLVSLTTDVNSACQSKFVDTIQIYPMPTADFYPTVEETYVNAQNLQFIYSGYGGVYFEWNFGDGTTAEGPSPMQNYMTSGNYDVELTVTNEFGCEASKTLENLKVADYDGKIFVPTAFSPNNDNLNEKFYIVSENVASMYFAIYNRWGELVYESEDISKGWDGTHKGQELNPDVFVYYLKGVFYDGESFLKKGNITLVR